MLEKISRAIQSPWFDVACFVFLVGTHFYLYFTGGREDVTFASRTAIWAYLFALWAFVRILSIERYLRKLRKRYE